MSAAVMCGQNDGCRTDMSFQLDHKESSVLIDTVWRIKWNM